MAYGVIQFLEDGKRVATLVRLENGQPTGADGLMDRLAGFIEETSPQMLAQGSPGALYLAELFTARELAAGRPLRVLGGTGALGIPVREVEALTGDGFYYELSVGPAGDRTAPPSIRMSPLPPRESRPAPEPTGR